MAKQVKQVYRFLAWFLAMLLAAGTFVGCIGGKYGPPPTPKYGPPPVTNQNNDKGNVN
ncbi:hypothetical protein NBE98_12080 [Clostridium swellfunianum]|uniref:hypothetical protein n=1 Tax=Clostridium swellfunianum TaxID=1367462 RepID=UPI00202F0E72|nr:hypothetical protein [Clostridium swellfunianum]MCM0649113.1 hypothetical protein [Clostridium swellfunianum]